MLHRPSNTLIVADLVVNFAGPQSVWERCLLRLATVRGGMIRVTRAFRRQSTIEMPMRHRFEPSWRGTSTGS
jgi:hypothetical protein